VVDHGKNHLPDGIIDRLVLIDRAELLTALVQEQLNEEQSCPLVAIGEPMIVGKRLDQRGSLLADPPIVPDVWASNSGFDRC
jgi:hypothetical protein